jgi:hypothetical protein
LTIHKRVYAKELNREPFLWMQGRKTAWFSREHWSHDKNKMKIMDIAIDFLNNQDDINPMVYSFKH